MDDLTARDGHEQREAAVKWATRRAPTPIGRGGSVLVALVAAVCAVPIVASTFPPCMDLPAHMALATAMRHLGDEGHVLDAAFRWGTFPAPNCGTYLLGYLLGFVLSPLAVQRAILLAYLVGTPVAFSRFLRAFDADPRVALLSIPLLVQWPFTEGFIDYCLGIAVLFVALASARRYLRAPSWRRAAEGACLGVLVFSTHVQIFVTYCVAIALLLCVGAWAKDARAWRASAIWAAKRAVALLALPLAVVIAWYARAGRDALGGEGIRTLSLTERLHALAGWSLAVLESPGGKRLALLVILAAATYRLMVFCFELRVAEPRPREPSAERFLSGLLAALVAGFLLLPLSTGRYWNLCSRIPALASFVALALGAGRAPQLPRGSRPLGALLVAPMLACAAYAAHAWHEAAQILHRESAGLFDVLASAPPRGRLVYAIELAPPTGFRSFVLRHAGQYYTVLREGTTSFSFANHPGRLIEQRVPGYDVEFLGPGELTKRQLSEQYDLLLLLAPQTFVPRPPTGTRLELLVRRGDWSLWKIGR